MRRLIVLIPLIPAAVLALVACSRTDTAATDQTPPSANVSSASQNTPQRTNDTARESYGMPNQQGTDDVGSTNGSPDTDNYDQYDRSGAPNDTTGNGASGSTANRNPGTNAARGASTMGTQPAPTPTGAYGLPNTQGRTGSSGATGNSGSTDMGIGGTGGTGPQNGTNQRSTTGGATNNPNGESMPGGTTPQGNGGSGNSGTANTGATIPTGTTTTPPAPTTTSTR